MIELFGMYFQYFLAVFLDYPQVCMVKWNEPSGFLTFEEKPGQSTGRMHTMRKWLFAAALALLMLLTVGAQAETYVLDEIYATIDIPESYTVVMNPDNLDIYATWLESRGMNVEDLRADFARRGVLLQCWAEDGVTCLEITARKDDRINGIFDVNQQSEDMRASYRLSHYPRNEYLGEGYDFSSSSWTKLEGDRYLALKYVHRNGGEVINKGFMRRTIYNGYEITLDLQVYGRNATDKDNNALNKVWKTLAFVETLPMPAVASAKINITTTPPEETNDRDFHIKGTAASGVSFTAVVMGMSYDGSILYEDTVDKSGKFDIPIELPKEGVFLITFFAEYEGEEVLELAYPVTYQRMLLMVNLDADVPADLTSDSLTLTGDSVAGAEIQVFLDGEAADSKRVNGEGRFKVSLDVDEEGPHELVLVFSKKGLSDRRLVYHFNRKWTDDDMLNYLKKHAVKPTYANLIKKAKDYEGNIVGFKAYLLDASQNGDGWLIRMALTRDEGRYKNIILVTANEEPSFESGDRVMMYGTYAGVSLSVSGDENEDAEEENLPLFELLLFATLE